MTTASNNSVQGRKQRKYRYTAANHLRRKMVFVHIGKELRAKLGTARRSIQPHKGDKAKVLRGDHRGHTGKIFEVDLSALKIYVEGANSRTAKGVEKLVALDPSNLVILEGEFVKDRLAALNRSPTAVLRGKTAPIGAQGSNRELKASASAPKKQ
ncbi:MAG: 50S ribosomal protein L24 [Candidatus Micrarchaeota archaeon]|nr:50S ribosomal protein L24 [Candidatus Micrarchaeota archaeon]